MASTNNGKIAGLEQYNMKDVENHADFLRISPNDTFVQIITIQMLTAKGGHSVSTE